MPYEGERAGLAAIRALAKADVVKEFESQLIPLDHENLPDFPPVLAECSRSTKATYPRHRRLQHL